MEDPEHNDEPEEVICTPPSPEGPSLEECPPQEAPPEYHPDWRLIARLRQQRDEQRKLLQDLDQVQEQLRQHKKQAKRDRSPELSDEDSPPPAVHRNRKPKHKALVVPDNRQLPYLQLKRAIRGCLDRYDCTDRQKRSILFAHAEDIKK